MREPYTREAPAAYLAAAPASRAAGPSACRLGSGPRDTILDLMHAKHKFLEGRCGPRKALHSLKSLPRLPRSRYHRACLKEICIRQHPQPAGSPARCPPTSDNIRTGSPKLRCETHDIKAQGAHLPSCCQSHLYVCSTLESLPPDPACHAAMKRKRLIPAPLGPYCVHSIGMPCTHAAIATIPASSCAPIRAADAERLRCMPCAVARPTREVARI